MKHPFESLKDHFLLAMPQLTDGLFAHSLTYICEHSEAGAMGIVVNRSLDLHLQDVLQHLKIDTVALRRDDPVMAGGPVQTDRGFVLHRATEVVFEATLPITETIAMTTSRDILQAIARNEGPANALVALGYAGWGAGQLEAEIAANAWLTLRADAAIIFDTPIAKRLHAAAAQLGVDLALLAPGAGHA